MHKVKPYVIGAVIGVVLVAGIGVVGLTGVKKIRPFVKKVISKLSDMRFKSVKKTDRELFIADFETPEDFKKFSDSNVDVALAKEFASSGNYSAKVTFKKSMSPSFRIEKYFEENRQISNWSPYGNFVFDIYNPSDSVQRLILQIKDRRGERYKQDVYVEPKTKATVDVDISGLRNHINVYHISQMNLFRWEPQNDISIYVDNMRLVPQGTKIKKAIFDPEFVNSKEPKYAIDYTYIPLSYVAPQGDRRAVVYVVNPHPVRLMSFPARGGIPFPEGELKGKSEISVKDAVGNNVAFQSKVMALWPDASIKWLLLDVPVDAQPEIGSVYYVNYTVKENAEVKNTFVREGAENIIVDTGKIKFSVSKKRFRLFDKVWIGGKEVISEGSDLTITFRGDVYYSSNDKDCKVVVEEAGPLLVGLKAEGWFVDRSGKKFCKFLVRIKAYKDESFVRVYHTFIYTGYPENKYHYLYKGMRLPKNETIEEIALELRTPEVFKDGMLTFAADNKVFQMKNAVENIKILQIKDDSFEAFKAEKEKIGEGKKLEGWLDLNNGEKGLCAIVRKMWQQYPKGFEIKPKAGIVKIKLWPAEAGVLDLKTTEKTFGPEDVARGSAFGLAKTHELVFYFHEGDYKQAKARGLAQVMQEPPILMASPECLSDSRALGMLTGYGESSERYKNFEDSIEKIFDWADRQKKHFRWYGMLDFGDTLSWYRQEAYDKSYDDWGWHPEGRWGWFNCEGVGSHAGALLQFLRTGKYKYFEFGEDLARHIMDVDTCHFNTIAYDKRLRRIFQDYSQPGSMHRHSGDHWGGRNEEASHTNLNGILLYYYITGYDRALDVAKEIGEFFLKHPITYFRHPDIAPHRGMANILWGDVALYEATGDERYKKDADYWANLFFQGQNWNGSFSEDYNPRDKKWDGSPHNGYMVGYTLPALIEYHCLTGSPAIKETIVKLTDYLMKNDTYGAIFEGLAYSYFLTGNERFLQGLSSRLDQMIRSQRNFGDPLWDGMIYQKLYYARVEEFLYYTPYAFEALLAGVEDGKDTIRD